MIALKRVGKMFFGQLLKRLRNQPYRQSIERSPAVIDQKASEIKNLITDHPASKVLEKANNSIQNRGEKNQLKPHRAETLSKIVDWEDRRTCVLFGDGAGAVIISATKESRGILATKLYSDGSWHDSLFSDGGPSFNQKVGKIRMNGQDIFKQAVNKLSESTSKALDQCNLSVKDIDWFIPHQANQRIISSTAKKLGISEDKTISTVKFHANTSAASIPLALSSAIKDGKIYADPVQHPDKIGRECIRAIVSHLSGEEVPAEVDIPASLYTKENADKDPSLN